MKKFKAFFLLISLTLAFICQAQSRVYEFANPKLTVFLPPKGLENGSAIVACPGGGYSHLAKDHEGFHWAPYFNNQGFAYAVLEYRLPGGDRTLPMKDVEDAFKILSDSAANWKIDPAKIGIMGSSAGGHLASTMATHPTEHCKPAFQILFYPVISLDSEITHQGTRKGFLGENPSEEMVAAWSSDNNVSPATSPAFIALSSDDKAVKPINSINYFNKLQENGVPVEMLIYPSGGHGWGYRSTFKQRDLMLEQLSDWLNIYAK